MRAELGGEVALLHDSAPGDVAGVTRARLGRAVRTHGGAEAVRADDEVGLDAGTAREAGDDLVAAMLDAGELAAEVIAITGECRVQRVEDAAPGAEVLRVVEARDHLAGSVEGAAAGDGDAGWALLPDAGGNQDRQQLAVPRDAEPARCEPLADTLEHVDLPALAQQHVGDEEPADRAPDHHGLASGCARFRHRHSRQAKRRAGSQSQMPVIP